MKNLRGKRNFFNAEKKELKLSKEKPGREKIKSNPFFQPGRGRFNIFVTLTDYCGGYPRARGRGGVFLIWLGLPDEYPRAMTAEVIPGREVGGVFLVRCS